MRRSGTSESGDVAHLHESQGAINVGPISVQLQTLSGGWCTASFRDRNISNRARILCPLVEAKRLLRESMSHFTVHAIWRPLPRRTRRGEPERCCEQQAADHNNSRVFKSNDSRA